MELKEIGKSKMIARIWTKAECKETVKEILQGYPEAEAKKDGYLIKVINSENGDLLFASTNEKDCLVRIRSGFFS
ncbi:MAG: hypothetical protein ACXACC_11010 [Promethearchaeota archaeon]|jgi:hypothetical protein